MTELAKKHGHGSSYKPLKRRMDIDGVGGGEPSVCKQAGTVFIALEDGQLATYTAPLVEGRNGTESLIPSLLGLTSLTDLRVVLDLVHNKLIQLGPGGMQLQLSPGSRVLNLQRAQTGHLMLPCSAWNTVKAATAVALSSEQQ
jgi:hypothetical protein